MREVRICEHSQVSSQHGFIIHLRYISMLGNPKELQVHNFGKTKDLLNSIGGLSEKTKSGSMRSVIHLPFFLPMSLSFSFFLCLSFFLSFCLSFLLSVRTVEISLIPPKSVFPSEEKYLN